MLAVGERVAGDLGVKHVRNADVDHVDVVGAGDLAPVGMAASPAPTARESEGTLRIEVGGGDELHVPRHVGIRAGDRSIGGAVGAGDVAGTDDADPHGLR